MADQGEGDESSAHIINVLKLQATNRAEIEEFLKPVTNKGALSSLFVQILPANQYSDQLCTKFALYQRAEYLKLDEIDTLQAVFEHFSVDGEGSKCKYKYRGRGLINHLYEMFFATSRSQSC